MPPEFPHSRYPHPPPHVPHPPPPQALALGRAPITWGGGVGIMGMWEFGGICELLFKLLFKLPKVGVGAFIFAPSTRLLTRATSSTAEGNSLMPSGRLSQSSHSTM